MCLMLAISRWALARGLGSENIQSNSWLRLEVGMQVFLYALLRPGELCTLTRICVALPQTCLTLASSAPRAVLVIVASKNWKFAGRHQTAFFDGGPTIEWLAWLCECLGELNLFSLAAPDETALGHPARRDALVRPEHLPGVSSGWWCDRAFQEDAESARRPICRAMDERPHAPSLHSTGIGFPGPPSTACRGTRLCHMATGAHAHCRPCPTRASLRCLCELDFPHRPQPIAGPSAFAEPWPPHRSRRQPLRPC